MTWGDVRRMAPTLRRYLASHGIALRCYPDGTWSLRPQCQSWRRLRQRAVRSDARTRAGGASE